MKKYKIKGESVDKTLNKLSKYLNIDKNKIEYKIINQKKNILGKIINVELEVFVEEKLKKEKEKIKKEEGKEKEISQKFLNKSKIEEIVEIEIQKDGIYLKIDESIYESEFSRKDIEEEILKKEIKEVDISKIELALNGKIGKLVKIAEYDKDYYIDAKVKIEVIKNALEVKMEILPPERGRDIIKSQIDVELKKNGIIYGIKEDLIDQIVENKYYNQQFIIAKGKPSEKGEDARIIYFFDTVQDLKFEEDQKGQVDYKTLGLLNNVTTGEVLAEKVLLTEGIEGINVYTNKIPAKSGKDRRFLKGKKVKLSNDKVKLVSMINGHVTLADKKVVVTPIKIVPQDVDYSVGNIDFIGTVFVKGNVNSGFKVKAKGDIIVDGMVEDCILESGGNISVRNGIVGQIGGKGLIKAKGQIKSKYLENIKVLSDKSIYIKDNIINSVVWAKENLVMEGDRGVITGGEVIAGEEIISQIIGSEFSNKTLISVGVYPEYRNKKNLLKEEILKIQKEIETLESDIFGLRKKNTQGKITPAQMKSFLEKTRKLLYNKTLLEVKKEKTRELTDVIENENLGKIHIVNQVYSGVVIKIGNRTLKIKDDLQNVTFFAGKKKNEIKLVPCEIGG